MIPGSPNERTCGTCSACCRWPVIPEIGKVARVPCHNLIDRKHGCEIYDDRPKTCADYLCSWRHGHGETDDQPNACHVLIDMKQTLWGPALVAKSLRPNAVRSRRGLIAIRRIAASRGALCFIVDDDDSVKIIGMAGPKKLLAAFQKKHGQPREILSPKTNGLDIGAIVADAMEQHKKFVADQVGAN